MQKDEFPNQGHLCKHGCYRFTYFDLHLRRFHSNGKKSSFNSSVVRDPLYHWRDVNYRKSIFHDTVGHWSSFQHHNGAQLPRDGDAESYHSRIRAHLDCIIIGHILVIRERVRKKIALYLFRQWREQIHHFDFQKYLFFTYNNFVFNYILDGFKTK